MQMELIIHNGGITLVNSETLLFVSLLWQAFTLTKQIVNIWLQTKPRPDLECSPDWSLIVK